MENSNEDAYNPGQKSPQAPKTSSTDGKSSGITTGDSEVQDGTGVETHEEKVYEKSDEQQEYLEDANSNTKLANKSPVNDGKGMTM